ncbi:MAG: DUF1559 domain-containing protein [Planctomycetes bacterium]|nr:DUF1559 domain-containing protein [Planctomycetota bacterium]
MPCLSHVYNSQCSALFLVGLMLVLPGCSKKANTSTAANADDPFSEVRGDSNRHQSQVNLQTLMIAMKSYEETHRCLPAADTRDETGRPMLSWRVYLLPYMDEPALYAQFHLNEPWDSEHNKKLIPKMPRLYELPGKGKNENGLTHYRVFVNPPDVRLEERTAFGGPTRAGKVSENPRITDITDGTSNTICIVEAEEPVVWTKPDELLYDAKKPVPNLLRNKIDRSLITVVDGNVRTLSKSINETTLRAFITRAGNENLPSD